MSNLTEECSIKFGCAVPTDDMDQAEATALAWVREAVNRACPGDVTASIGLADVDRTARGFIDFRRLLDQGEIQEPIRIVAVQVLLNDASKCAPDGSWLLNVLGDPTRAGLHHLYTSAGKPITAHYGG